MRKIFIILLFLFMLSGVVATGFSPSSLVFELEQNEEGCGTITTSSDSSKISVSDLWAENEDIEWKVSNFESSAVEHGISIDYDDELLVDEREVEVCVSGNEVGEFHGVILLKEEQEGSSIVQMGIWIKLTVVYPEEEEIPEQIDNNNGGGSSSGGGSSGGDLNVVENTTTNEKDDIVNEDVVGVSELSDEKNVEDKIGGKKTLITGGVVGGVSGNKWIIILSVLVLVIGGVFIYYKKSMRN